MDFSGPFKNISAYSKLYPQLNIEFVAKMSRRGILIAYKDQVNTLSFNACPVTTHLAENQKLSATEFIDFCQQYFNQQSKPQPDYQDFSNVNLISM